MIRLNILCEGKTEELFVKIVLKNHFDPKKIYLFTTGLDGGFNYDRLKHNIIKSLNADKNSYVSMMVDLYGLKGEYPGYSDNINRLIRPLQKIEAIELAVKSDIVSSKKLQNKNFIPYFQLHEFEALLFSNPKIMEEYFSLDQNVPENSFLNIRNEFETPEHINNSRFTAPSKRIKGIIQSYDKKKTLDGASIAEKIGLPTIRSHCPHFNDWILQLENLTEL